MKIFFYEERDFSWIFITMKRIPLKVKKEVINFRLTHSWKETCDQFPKIDEETWRLWMKRKEEILNTPELSKKEMEEIRIFNYKKSKEKYKKKNPDKVISSLMRIKHPLVVCSYHANGNYKKYKSKNKSPFTRLTPLDLYTIVKRQRLICPITGLKLTAENISVDHIIPVSKGGSNSPDNIRLVHKMINHMKNYYSDTQFFDMCSLVVKNFKPLN
jgi:5-methylcytosine-specific restriction endonuclease McrA